MNDAPKPFYVHYDPAWMGYAFHIVGKDPYNGKRYVPKVEWEEVDNTTVVYHAAPFILNETELQGLADALWAAGIRPSATKQEVNLKSLENHIADLRKIAFKSLEIDDGV